MGETLQGCVPGMRRAKLGARHQGLQTGPLPTSLPCGSRTGAGRTLTPDRTQETQLQADSRVGFAFLHSWGLPPQHSPQEGARQAHSEDSTQERRPRPVPGPPARGWHQDADTGAGPARPQQEGLEGLISEQRSKGLSRLSPWPQMKGGPEGGQSLVTAW